jgi:hypothetical protein
MTKTLTMGSWEAIEHAKALGYAAGLGAKPTTADLEMLALLERFGYIVTFAYNSEFDRGDRERRAAAEEAAEEE